MATNRKREGGERRRSAERCRVSSIRWRQQAEPQGKTPEKEDQGGCLPQEEVNDKRELKDSMSNETDTGIITGMNRILECFTGV